MNELLRLWANTKRTPKRLGTTDVLLILFILVVQDLAVFDPQSHE